MGNEIIRCKTERTTSRTQRQDTSGDHEKARRRVISDIISDQQQLTDEADTTAPGTVEKRAKAAETMSCSFIMLMLVLLSFISKQNYYGNFGAAFVRVLVAVAICQMKWFGLCFWMRDACCFLASRSPLLL